VLLAGDGPGELALVEERGAADLAILEIVMLREREGLPRARPPATDRVLIEA
jgi:hypothetical protein